MESLAIVVSCTNGKRLQASDALSWGHGRSPANAATWTQQLDEAESQLPLTRLYKGQQWTASLDLAPAAREHFARADVLVMSAGLGLVPVNSQAPGYQASFSPGPHVVGEDAAARKGWWHSLATTPSRGLQRTRLADVRAVHDQLLIVLAPSYLSVLMPEIRAIEDDGVLVVTSGRTSSPREISSSSLRTALGGSDATVNARVARRMLDLVPTGGLSEPSALARWREWAHAQAATARPTGRPLEDSDVQHLIQSWLREGPASRTNLLRRLRAEGWACEQRRFAHLYDSVPREAA